MKPRLKLSYNLERSSEFRLHIVEQDESTRNPNNEEMFFAKNDWKICSNVCPEISGKMLYIRGTSRGQDNRAMYCSGLHVLVQLAQAVAEFNGRKNTVELGAEGFIY